MTGGGIVPSRAALRKCRRRASATSWGTRPAGSGAARRDPAASALWAERAAAGDVLDAWRVLHLSSRAAAM